LAFAPDYRYFTNFIPGGLPSHLAIGDTIVLVEAYPPSGASIYQTIPANENAPATAGTFEKHDVARVIEGPFRTDDSLLYWRIDNLNGSEDGYIQEYTRLSRHYRLYLRPPHSRQPVKVYARHPSAARPFNQHRSRRCDQRPNGGVLAEWRRACGGGASGGGG
jgi:hypothetical protein